METLNNTLITYLKENIFSQYSEEDKDHGTEHIQSVIDWSFKIHKFYTHLDINMIYAAAIYHDIGNIYASREEHANYAYNYVLEDKLLTAWFTYEEINLIALACKEHRSSYKGEFSSDYSRILNDADVCGNVDLGYSIKRALSFGLKHEPHLTEQESYERVYHHLNTKYGRNGYSTLKTKAAEYLLGDSIENLRKLLSSEELFKEEYYKLVI